MKKTYFFLASFTLFLSFYTSNAQNLAQGRSRIEISGFWLPQTNWLLNPNDYFAFREKDYILDYSYKNFGGSIGWYSKGFLGVSLGFIHSEQGQTYLNREVVAGIVVNEFRTRTKLTYYKYSLLFSYKADPSAIIRTEKGKNRQPNFFFEFGPQLSYIQRGAFRREDTKLVVLDPEGSEIDHIDLFAPYNIDLVLGIGGNFKLSNHLFFHILFRFDYSINDIENKTALTLNGERFYPIDRLATNAGTAGINLGFGYSIFTSRR